MAKNTPPPVVAAPVSKIRFLELDVCHGSVWARHEIMVVTDDNRVDADLAVKRGMAEYVNDANPASNAPNT
ncbi:MAG: hypothetical protein WAU96_10575 [Anaerolineae bacterium]